MYSKNSQLIAKLRQFIATICLGAITFGMSLSWTSPVLPQLQNQNSSLPFTLTVAEGSWVGSMLAFGVLFAAIPSGYLADRFGLKKCIVALALPNVIFTIIVIFSKDVYSLCIARFISGMAGGGVSVVSPLYIAEISEISIRGILGSFFEFLLFVGVILISICGAYLHYITLTIIFGLCSLVLGIVFLFFPESPTYLIKINQTEKAKAALQFYRSDDYDVTDDLKQMYQNLQKQQHGEKVNLKQALMSKSVKRGLIASVGLGIYQQLSAVDAITFYSVQLFQKADTAIDAYTSAIILSTVQLLSAVFMVLIIERAGRKFFLYASALGCSGSLLLLAVYFQLKDAHVYFVGMDYTPLITVIIVAISFALALGPIPMLVNGELFSSDVKGVANGIAITTNWITMFLVTKTFPIVMEDVGPQYLFYFYAICMVSCLVFIKFCVPETKGKSLTQIQNELSS